MPAIAKINVLDGDPTAAVRGLLESLLTGGTAAAVLVQRRTPGGGAPMPALVTDPARLDEADPLAPGFPLNGARLLAKLTRGDSDGMIAAIMRPCEIRAFVELTKLNQGSLDNTLLVGVDCPGAFDNAAYRAFSAGRTGRETTRQFLGQHLAGGVPAAEGSPGLELAGACLACEHPTAEAADWMIGLFGNNPEKVVTVIAQTPRGQAALSRLGLEEADPALAEKRRGALEVLKRERIAHRDRMFEKTRAATDSLDKLAQHLSGCVNCYNCRVACPVCYCRECVFVTDVFDHKPWQFMNWARQKGALRLPSDTLFYHLTRLAHMSAACVGCGQCSNACPNDVPVMELFRMTAHGVQEAFGYEAGRHPEEPPPLAVFMEREFSEVTDGVD